MCKLDYMRGNRVLCDGTTINVTYTISRQELRVPMTHGTKVLCTDACDKDLRKGLLKVVVIM